LDVRLERETLWMTQSDMAQLFQCSADNISLHLKNIFEEGELDSVSTTEDFSVVRQEGVRQVARKLTHYNLDVVISVGYRIKTPDRHPASASGPPERLEGIYRQGVCSER